MLFNKKIIIFESLMKAIQLRKVYNVDSYKPICIHDFAEKAGVEIRFKSGISSLEGMYSKKPGPVIIISSERPAGRQSFTCAHEFGHHIFKHGTRFDEIIKENDNRNYSPEEFQADCFAGFLLMPKIAIQKSFNDRGWNMYSPNPKQIFILSKLFNVGYSTLITHMEKSLKILTSSKANKLLKVKPKNIRKEIYKKSEESDLFIIDNYWKYRAIDIQVDDIIIVGDNIKYEGKNIIKIGENGKNVLKGISPGISKLFNDKEDWTSFVRVSIKNYNGLSKYRHFENI